jgi:hypothetical protein
MIKGQRFYNSIKLSHPSLLSKFHNVLWCFLVHQLSDLRSAFDASNYWIGPELTFRCLASANGVRCRDSGQFWCRVGANKPLK